MFTLEELGRALASKPIEPKEPFPIQEVSIDTRTLASGDAFFAIRGRNLDGHRFVREAKEKGASAFVVEKRAWEDLRPFTLHNVFLVEDTTLAFGELARYVRRKCGVRALAVTGSCGKTTTKQMAEALLGRRFKVLATEGNLNNQFGLPLTILKLRPDHEILLAEIGASRPGDITYLSDILEPGLGLITNIHPAHLEGFGSLEKVYEAKLELAAYLEKSGGMLIVNGDDEELVALARGFRLTVLTFGRKKHNGFAVTHYAEKGENLQFELNGRYRFEIRTRALFNLDNFVAAIALAHTAGVSFERLEGMLKEFQPVPGRFEKYDFPSGISVIHDAYNANPGSMMQALEAFAARAARKGPGRKIAVLADMMELGGESELLHRRVGTHMKGLGIDVLFTVGSRARAIANTAQAAGACREIMSFEKNGDLIPFLASFLRSGDEVLLKGSRSMKLEEILNALKQ